jgi:hypothetical protein
VGAFEPGGGGTEGGVTPPIHRLPARSTAAAVG